MTDTAATGPGDVEANINWGDGTSATSGAIETDALGDTTYNVVGDHTYYQTGTYNMTTTVTDGEGNTNTATPTADVSGLALTGQNVSMTAGQTFTDQVATFTDTSPDAAVNSYTATVDWGNGNGPVAATISSIGTHEYSITASNTLTDTTLQDAIVSVTASDGLSSETIDNLTVADTPPVVSPAIVQGTAGSAVNATVATFSYTDANAAADEFQVSINWGDGNTSDGTVTSTGTGEFSVSGANTFASAGTYFPVVTVEDPQGESTTATDTALVYSGTPSSGVPGASTVNQAAGYTLFLSPIAPTSGTVSSWLINWGDGTTGDPDTQTISGTQTFVQHTFANGTASANISYEAENSSGGNLKSGTWPVTVVPAVPTAVTATWNSDGSISLGWSEDSSLANSIVVTESVNGGPFSSMGSFAASSTGTTLEDLNYDNSYAFAVTASDSSGTTSPAVTTSITQYGGPGPDTPTLTEVGTASDSEIDMSYTAQDDGSNLELEEESPGYNFVVIDTLEPGNDVSLPESGLEPDSQYSFRIRADLNGEVAYSSTVTDTTTSGGDDLVLDSITANTTTQTAPAWDVTWSGPTTIYLEDQMSLGDDLYFNEDYNGGGGPTPISNDDDSAPLGENGWDLGVGIDYRAVAYPPGNYGDGANLYDPSNYESFSYQGSPADGPSGLVMQNNGDGTANFTWTYTGDGGVTLFVASYEAGNGVVTYDGDYPATNSAGTEADDVPIPTTGSYVFFAQALQGNDGGSPISLPSNVITLDRDTGPTTPENLYAAPLSSNSVGLVWDNDSNNETSFVLQRSVDGSGVWNDVGGTTEDVANYVDTGISPDQLYDYRVYATNSYGPSGYSNEFKIGVTNAFHLQLGDGSPDQILWISDDGTQNQLPVTMEIPQNLPSGMQVTLSVSTPNKVDVWSPDNTDNSALLFGAGNGSNHYTWTIGNGPYPPDHVMVGSVAGSDSIGDIVFTLSALAAPGSGQLAPTTGKSNDGTAEGLVMELDSGNNGIAVGTQIQNNNNIPWLVGQEVVAIADPIGPEPVTWQWNIGGSPLYQYSISPTIAYTLPVPAKRQGGNGALFGTLENEVLFFWTQAGSYQVSVTETAGDGKQHSASATFNVQAPSPQTLASTTGTPSMQGDTVVYSNNPDPDPVLQNEGFVATASVPPVQGFNSGNWTYIQLDNAFDSFDFLQNGVEHGVISNPAFHEAYDQDAFPPDLEIYDRNGGIFLPSAQAQVSTSSQKYSWTDYPRLQNLNSPNDLPGFPNSHINLATALNFFQVYIMYLPPGSASQWVPLQKLYWTEAQVATLIGGTWHLTGIPPIVLTGWQTSTQEPTWTLTTDMIGLRQIF